MRKVVFSIGSILLVGTLVCVPPSAQAGRGDDDDSYDERGLLERLLQRDEDAYERGDRDEMDEGMAGRRGRGSDEFDDDGEGRGSRGRGGRDEL